MPKAFEDCIARGGRVRSKDLGNGSYIKICFIDGKSYPGETHQYKKVLGKGKNAKKGK